MHCLVFLDRLTQCCLCADAEYSADGGYAQHIQAAVGAASSALLDTVTRAGLRQTLAALKSYFLLARGDLFTVFVDIAEAELAKNAADVILTRLQSLLELGANWVCFMIKKKLVIHALWNTNWKHVGSGLELHFGPLAGIAILRQVGANPDNRDRNAVTWIR